MHKTPFCRFIVLGVSVGVAFIILHPPITHAAQAQAVIQTNQPWEKVFTSSRTYANPFIDVTVTVEYTKPGSPPIRSLAFWDGGKTFKMRMAFPEVGTWTYRTTSSDIANTRLHNQTGTVQVSPYKGSNPLYQHG